MNIRWIWLNHVPRGLPLSEDQRREVLKRARAHRMAEQNYRGTARDMAKAIILLTIPLSLLFTGAIVALVMLRPRAGVYAPLLSLTILGFILIDWAIVAWGLYRSHVPYIRKALCDIGEPVCLECGYALRGLHEREKCPECGAGHGKVPTANQEHET